MPPLLIEKDEVSQVGILERGMQQRKLEIIGLLCLICPFSFAWRNFTLYRIYKGIKHLISCDHNELYDLLSFQDPRKWIRFCVWCQEPTSIFHSNFTFGIRIKDYSMRHFGLVIFISSSRTIPMQPCDELKPRIAPIYMMITSKENVECFDIYIHARRK